MPVTVPLDNTRAFFKQTSQLDGRDFILRFQFNQRLCRWYVGIYDNEDNPLVLGLRLSVNFPLARVARNTDPRFPQGGLLMIDLEAENNQLARDACFKCLGDRQILMYFEADEIAALEAA